MSERGVFAVDRGIWDHPSFRPQPFTDREAFMWLVGEAAYRPRRARVGAATVELSRGQLSHSLRFMAGKWRWSEAAVRRFLERLKTDAVIDADSDAGATRITICNYDRYQRVSLPTDAATDAGGDAEPTQDRRKVEDTKDKKDSLLSDRTMAMAGERPARKAKNDDFERFRAAYPKRDGTDPKEPARKKFEAMVKSGINPDLIIAGAEVFAAAEQKRGNIGSRFIPHSATWLNKRQWEDHQPQRETSAASEAESWRIPVENWRRDPSTWASHAWGPAPGEPGCQVPKSLLTNLAQSRGVH